MTAIEDLAGLVRQGGERLWEIHRQHRARGTVVTTTPETQPLLDQANWRAFAERFAATWAAIVGRNAKKIA